MLWTHIVRAQYFQLWQQPIQWKCVWHWLHTDLHQELKKKIVNLIFIFMDFRNWKIFSWNRFFNTSIPWKWTTYWPPPASPTLSINLVRSSSRTLIYWSRYSCKRWLVLGDSLTRPSTPSKISLSLICGDISAHGWL